MPKISAALSNAGCALTGSTSSGLRQVRPLDPRALARRADAQDDALRSAGGDIARAARAAEQLGAHAHEIRLERGEALEHAPRPEPVGGHEERVRLAQEPQMLLARPVDQAEGPALLPGEIAGHGPLEQRHHLIARLSLDGQLHGVLPWVPRSSRHRPTAEAPAVRRSAAARARRGARWPAARGRAACRASAGGTPSPGCPGARGAARSARCNTRDRRR